MHHPHFNFVLRSTWLLMLCSPLLLVGCGAPQALDKTKTQVVAKVNGEEVTVHEVNQYVAHRAQLDGTLDQIRKTAVDAVIDQHLLQMAAKQAKLDRDMAVVQAELESKKQILIDAYKARQFGALMTPTADQITAYYHAHPALFADRKLYQLKSLHMQINVEKQNALLDELKASASIDTFIASLKAQHIQYDLRTTLKAPEDMNAVEQSILTKMKIGEAAILNQDQDSISITTLIATQPQPIVLDNAQLQITDLLRAQNKLDQLALWLKTARQQAKITYIK